MYYKFQESKIWESGDPVDPDGAKVTVRAKDEASARKKLKVGRMGRTWVLVGTK